MSVLLLEDQANIRDSFKLWLEVEAGFTVVAVADLDELADELDGGFRPNVALVDIMIGHVGHEDETEEGFKVPRMIKARSPKTKCLVYSAFEPADWIRRALRKKGMNTPFDGYVTKRMPNEDIVKAIRHVVSGGIFIRPERLSALTSNEDSQELTLMETKALQGKANGLRGEGFVNAVTDAKGATRSRRTVTRYLTSAMEKLGARTVSEAVAIAIERHLIQPPRLG